jgi:hypothetical protein
MAEIDDDAMLDVNAAERLIGLRKATLARCMGGGPHVCQSWQAGSLSTQRFNYVAECAPGAQYDRSSCRTAPPH